MTIFATPTGGNSSLSDNSTAGPEVHVNCMRPIFNQVKEFMGVSPRQTSGKFGTSVAILALWLASWML